MKVQKNHAYFAMKVIDKQRHVKKFDSREKSKTYIDREEKISKLVANIDNCV